MQPKILIRLGLVLAVLLAAGWQFQSWRVRTSNEKLLEAVRQKDVEAMRPLIRTGADVHLVADPDGSGRGTTPLMVAAREGSLAVVMEILVRNVPLDLQDAEGATALHHAAAGGYADVLRVLLSRGAAIDARDAAGNTPLMRAAEAGHLGVLPLLLEQGADPQARNEAGRTALDLAREKEQAAAVRYLEQALPYAE